MKCDHTTIQMNVLTEESYQANNRSFLIADIIGKKMKSSEMQGNPEHDTFPDPLNGVFAVKGAIGLSINQPKDNLTSSDGFSSTEQPSRSYFYSTSQGGINYSSNCMLNI